MRFRRLGGIGVLSNWYLGLLVAAIAVYYLFLLSNGTLQLFAPEMLDKAYGNMLLHLLRDEFTVDRDVIDFEAFTRDGKTYTYFGIFPALLRLPALPFVDLATAQLARLSCLAAVVIFVALQLRMLLIVHGSLPPRSRSGGFLGIMIAATALSGPQLYVLAAASIYYESILWAAALGAAFNLMVVRAAFAGRSLRNRDLVLLALFAGLAINTRPTIGVALSLGTVLLVGWTAWGRRPKAALVRDLGIWLPFAILAVLAAGAGYVNYERWGNPLTFADFRYHYWGLRHANFLPILHDYGEFNLGRVWIGMLYYATGLPYLVKSMPPFAAFLNARIGGIEAPPLTPLLVNPLLILLAGIGIFRLCRKPALPGGAAALLRLTLIGNAAAVLLILAAMYYTLRYRFDLAPFVTLSALVGYHAVSGGLAGASDAWRRRLYAAALGLCVLGILGSHYILLVHKVWSIAVPMPVRLALFPYAPFAHAAFEP